MTALVDRAGRQVSLGAKIAQGGEGAVYSVAGNPHWVAKIYLRPPSRERQEKLAAMVALNTGGLEKLTAWPLEILRDPKTSQVCGFVMPNAGKLKEAHKLYSPKSRAVEFQRVEWGFLIHAAANVARSFAAVHQAGHVIGDVNHSSVLIAQDGTVRLIDCDSFQIQDGGKRFLCEVGEPFHTPPELQAKPFAGVVRSPNHDNFGLAVLIFELLFMGRHPYAGAFTGTGDLSLENKIAQFRFAYGVGASSRQMKAPPNTLALEAVGPKVASMFEMAFSAVGASERARPTAAQWVGALVELQSQIRDCPSDGAHRYWSNLAACPWCDIEAKTGVTLFTVPFAASTNNNFDLTLVWEQIAKVAPPAESNINFQGGPTPEPHAQFLAVRRQRLMARWIGAASTLLIAIVFLTISASGAALLAVLIGAAVTYAISEQGVGELTNAAHQNLNAARAQLSQLEVHWNATATSKPFTAKRAELEAIHRKYMGIPAERQRQFDHLKNTLRDRQLERYLDRYVLRPGLVSGIGEGRCITLRSQGIETAWDVNLNGILQIQGFGPALAASLVAWRQSLESLFVFQPNVGIDPADIAKIDADLGRQRTELEQRLSAGASELRQISNRITNAQQALEPSVRSALHVVAQAEANLRAVL